MSDGVDVCVREEYFSFCPFQLKHKGVSMEQPVYRLIFVDERCGFLTTRNEPITINDRTSYHLPRAELRWLIAVFLKEWIQRHFKTEVHLPPTSGKHDNHFMIHFPRAVHLETPATIESFIVGIDHVNELLHKDQLHGIDNLHRIINDAGCHILQWILEALTAHQFEVRLTSELLIASPVHRFIR